MGRLPNPTGSLFSVIPVYLLRFLEEFHLHLHINRRAECPGTLTIPAICPRDSIDLPQLVPADPTTKHQLASQTPKGGYLHSQSASYAFPVLPDGYVFQSNQETSFSLSPVYSSPELRELDFFVAAEYPAVELSDAEGHYPSWFHNQALAKFFLFLSFIMLTIELFILMVRLLSLIIIKHCPQCRPH
jgi:hypothetical protein